MNFRSTTLLFGLLLGMLWLFGLTVARKKTAVDASFLVPSLQAHPDTVIDSITIKRRVKDKQPEEFQFTKEKDDWTLKMPGVQKSVKLDAFKVNQIVNQIKDARRSDEAEVSDDVARYGLDQPATTVILKGKSPGRKEEQKWEFFLGNESPAQGIMYVNSSDRPDKAFAINKSNIDSVFFKDPNHLRSRRIFQFSDTAVQSIDIKDGTSQLDLRKNDDATWRFEKPALGYADFEGQPAPKDLPPGAKATEGGVKGLLASIATMRVDSDDDFVPLSDSKLDSFGLEDGKETMRIEVDTIKEKGDKKEPSRETLVIGARIKDKNQAYARLVGEEGIFKLNTQLLEPIKTVLQNPGSLRSMVVTNLDPKKVDAITLEQKGEKVTLLRAEGQPWEVQVGTGKLQKANNPAIDDLLNALQGKPRIVKFFDGEDYKKLDAEMKTPVAVISLFLGGRDDGGKDKKDQPPQLKKDAKPAVTLSFGAVDKDTVNVQRVLANGATSRFALPKAILDQVVPGDIQLAFLDISLPTIDPDNLDRVVIAGDREKIDIEKGRGEKANRWFFKEGQETPGKSPTDDAEAKRLIDQFLIQPAKKWLRMIDPKEDLDKYGLNKPALEVTLFVKKENPATTVSMVGLLATLSEWRGVLGGAALLANRLADPGEKVVLKIGKETDADKDKPGFFAMRSDKDMLFIMPSDQVLALKKIDLHDRTGVLLAQPLVSAFVVGLAAEPFNIVWATSPLATNRVLNFDPAKAKEIKLAVRTPEELRTFHFQRDPQLKSKNWRDLSGLHEFNLDSQKVDKALENLSQLQAIRWVNLSGGAQRDQKLAERDATLRIEILMEDGKKISLFVGAPFMGIGYYAQTNAAPEAVFLLAPAQVEPYLRGTGYFAKDRLVAGP